MRALTDHRPDPTNYSPEAAEHLVRFAAAARAQGATETEAVTLSLVEILLRAPKYLLPNGGRYLERTELAPEEMVALRLPAPRLVLEFSSVGRWGRTVPERAQSTKRIVVVQDVMGGVIGGVKPTFRHDQPAIEDGILAQPICWLDEFREWMPTMAAAFIPRRQTREEVAAARERSLSLRTEVEHRFHDELIRTHPIREVRDRHILGADAVFKPVYLFPELCPDPTSVGATEDEATLDVIDEIWAVVEFSTVLGLPGVETETLPAPAALNKSRRKKGKAPLPAYRVLRYHGTDAAPH